ncbi:MAG: ribosome maturation factor RimM [Clostridioides sp.]|jgi:16S rRNA processing protein RimM|nr:ribosome maturation factor RimM [Clostridioides sp.]
MSEKLSYFKIGQIVNTIGLKGEVKIYPLTSDIYRYDELQNFCLDNDLNKSFEVEKVRYKGNMVIMKIKNINSIEEAERLRNKYLYVDRENAASLDDEEYFIADLIGLDVYTSNGDYIGKVKDVLQYSANDVYVVESIKDVEDINEIKNDLSYSQITNIITGDNKNNKEKKNIKNKDCKTENKKNDENLNSKDEKIRNKKNDEDLNSKDEKVKSKKDNATSKSKDAKSTKNKITKEYLIPAVAKFVPEIDLENNKMIIEPIKGMLD